MTNRAYHQLTSPLRVGVVAGLLVSLVLLSPISAQAEDNGSSAQADTAASSGSASNLHARSPRSPIVQMITAAPSRAKMVRRAQSWVNAHVAYNGSREYTNRFGTYRQDCSGYVSLAWRLPSSYTTRTLPDIAHRIPESRLRRGDVLLHSSTARTSGHVVLFDQWVDATHTSYLAYEETPDGGAVHHALPYPYWHGHGTYTPYRRDAT